MSNQTVLINTKLGVSKEKPRIWIEGHHLRKAGLNPGMTLGVKFDSGHANLAEDIESPDHAVKVSKRTYKGVEKPLLEIRHDKLAELFGDRAKIRIIARQGRLIIRLHHITERARARIKRLKKRLSAGEKLQVGSLFHGGGTLDHAFHDGLERSGIQSTVSVVNELESRFLGSSTENNHHLWDDDTIFLHSAIEDLDLSRACSLDVVLAGIPCTGASLAGRASKKLKFAEQHETAGALFFSFLEFVKATNAAIVVLENVPLYQSTASYSVICSVLQSLGYAVNDVILNGNDFGALEGRDRLFMVATTEGLPEVDLSELLPVREKEATASEVLDPVPLDSDAWREFPYLDKAEQKAVVKGNGFKRNYIDPESSTTNTIKKTNHKCQTDGVFVRHPTDPTKSRLPRGGEHARLKTVPESIIQGASEKLACEILGQGIVHAAGVSLAMGVAEQCLAPPLNLDIAA